MNGVDLSGAQFRGACSTAAGCAASSWSTWNRLRTTQRDGERCRHRAARRGRTGPPDAGAGQDARPTTRGNFAKLGRSWKSFGTAPSRGRRRFPRLRSTAASTGNGRSSRRCGISTSPAQRGWSDDCRQPVAVASAGSAVGRGARLGRHPLGSRGAAVTRRGAHGPKRASGHGADMLASLTDDTARVVGHPHRSRAGPNGRTSRLGNVSSSSSTRSGSTGCTPNGIWMRLRRIPERRLPFPRAPCSRSRPRARGSRAGTRARCRVPWPIFSPL